MTPTATPPASGPIPDAQRLHRLATLPAHREVGARPASSRSPLALAFWRRYARWRVAGAFDGLHVAGLDEARALLAAGPVVFAATHTAWWDGFLMLLVDEALDAEGHVLVEATSLARLPWLRGIGAIPLDRSGPASARAGLRAARAVLEGPRRCVWIFPQGRQRPAWLRPLDLHPGAGLVARAAGAPIVPVALTYAFREDARPAAVVHLGAPVAAEGLEAALVAGLDAIDAFLDPTVGGRGGAPPATPPHRDAEGATPAGTVPAAAFRPLVPGRGARTDDGLAARLLARLTGAR